MEIWKIVLLMDYPQRSLCRVSRIDRLFRDVKLITQLRIDIWEPFSFHLSRESLCNPPCPSDSQDLDRTCSDDLADGRYYGVFNRLINTDWNDLISWARSTPAQTWAYKPLRPHLCMPHLRSCPSTANFERLLTAARYREAAGFFQHYFTLGRWICVREYSLW